MPIFYQASGVDASHSNFYDVAGDVNFATAQHDHFNGLSRVVGAAYNSSARESFTGCLSGTRADVLHKIHNWINTKDSPLFWLSGVAGTGKTTIAHSIAETYDRETSRLGSFFFSRDQQARREARFLFQTVAFQLGCAYPALKREISKAIEDQTILTSKLQRQFQRLILDPISNIGDGLSSPITIVLDALDECEDEDAVSRIIQLLAEELGTRNIPLKILVTSRPEIHIRTTFASPNISHSTHPFVLHEVKLSDVQRDIQTFVKHEFRKIADNCREILEQDLWPKDDEVETLVDFSAGLFIAASTAVKFVSPIRGSRDPRPRLKMIVDTARGKSGSGSNHSNVFKELDALYTQILEHAVSAGQSSDVFADFQTIVGTIVLAYGRLTVIELGELLQSRDKIRSALAELHSVILVPEGDGVVHAFHLSFHDYLTDKNRCSNPNFYIDVPLRHNEIARLCLERMELSLKRDICDIRDRSKMNREIEDLERKKVQHLPGDLQYACRYWALHLSQCGSVDSLFSLLRSFFFNSVLYWLEVLSLVGDLDGGLHSLRALQAKLESATSPPSELLEFLRDTERFLLEFYDVISVSALHVYYSALVFTPRRTLLYETFSPELSKIEGTPDIVSTGGDVGWSTWLRIMEGHSDSVSSVTISHDNTRIISGSDDGTICVWNARTGAAERTLEGHSRFVRSVVISHDDTRVISGSADKTAIIWDARTGVILRTLKGHSDWIKSVAISHDDTRVISGSNDKTIRVWDVETGTVLHTLMGHSHFIASVAFSHDDTRIVSGSDDMSIRIWDARRGTICLTLEGHSDWVKAVVFSHDNTRVISGSFDKTIRIWDARAGTVLRVLRGHAHSVTSIAISHDDNRIVSGSADQTIRIWEAGTGAILNTLKGHRDQVNSIVISHDGVRIISSSDDKTIRIWDSRTSTALHKTARIWKVLTGLYLHKPDAEPLDLITVVAISHDDSCVVSGSSDNIVRIWDARTGVLSCKLKGHSRGVTSIAISQDDTRVISGSYDGNIRIWNVRTGASLKILKGRADSVLSVTISHDGTLVIAAYDSNVIRIWDTRTAAVLHILEERENTTWVKSVIISYDDTRVIAVYLDYRIRIWDARSGAILHTLEGHTDVVTSVDISRDGNLVISWSLDDTVRIWDALSGSQIKILSLPDKFSVGHTGSVRFSPDESFIVAGGHSFPVSLEHQRPSQTAKVSHSCSVVLRDGWLLEGDRKICWVPPYRRGFDTVSQSSSVVAFYADSVITIFHGSSV